MKKRIELQSFVSELALGLSPLVLSSLLLFILISLDYVLIGVAAFIIVITLGTTGVFLFLFREKELSLLQFLFNMIALILLTITIFSFVYAIQPQGQNTMVDNGVPTELTFNDALYFSTVTITTLGYGDIAPRGFFRFFAMIEVLLGLFYLGLFIAGLGHIYDR